MPRIRHLAGLLLIVLSASASAGEREQEMTPADLPADILNECRTVAPAGTDSCVGVRYLIDRIGRTPDGDLFLVRHNVCRMDGCRTWLVARSVSGFAHTLLAMIGELRIEYHGNAFPTVETRRELAGNYTRYTRFEWAGDGYARTESRLVYRIDDFECADEAVCYAEAQEALKHDQVDRALRIWEQVYGVNWI